MMSLTKEKNPQVLICGYCKSGTTIIAKTYAYCVNLSLQDEVRKLWGITKLADVSQTPNGNMAILVQKKGLWKHALLCIQQKPILKFPEGVLILDLFPMFIRIICVIRHPLDTICAYLERKHEFKALKFSEEELISIAHEWNYYILSIRQSEKEFLLISYESFVSDPESVIKQIADFSGHTIRNSVPVWVAEQAQKYLKFVPEGQPVRGRGRYKMSIKDDSIMQRILEVCFPALDFLRDSGITFSDLKIK